MSKDYSKVLKNVLKKITPGAKEKKKLETASKKLLRLVKNEAKKYKADAILAGSVTRDTWLADKLEFDIFILFPESMSRKRMEELGIKIGKGVVKKLGGEFKIEYAEHPYVSAKINEINVDIVPCYKLKTLERIKSAVDRTPFHVQYLEKKFPLKRAKEVRLLKQFLKANEIYGADAKTQGFSGYVCELLIIKYKSFMELLKAAVKWKPGEIIDLEKFYSQNEYKKLRIKFKNQPLIVIDPVDKNRNAAAAVSVESFFKFKKLAKNFIKKPTPEIFFKKIIKPLKEVDFIKKLRERETEVIIIKFNRPKVVDDIIWPQLRKFAERIQSILQGYSFKVIGKDVLATESLCYVLFELEIYRLPRIEKRVGPIVFDFKGSENFIRKYKSKAIVGPYIEKNRWAVEIKREFLTAKQKIFDSLNKPLEILKAKGIPSYVAEEISKGFEIFAGSEIVSILEDREFSIFLKKYFEKEKLI